MKTFILRIFTNAYAGNFEREICAFCTGAVGDSNVGFEEAKLFGQLDNPVKDGIGDKMQIIYDEHDDNWVRLGSDTKSIEFLFSEELTVEELDFIIARAIEFAATEDKYRKPFKIIKWELVEEVATSTIIRQESV